jgi:hypothetical protein
VAERRSGLLALDHAMNPLDLADQIGAAEFQLFTAAARTQCIRID